MLGTHAAVEHHLSRQSNSGSESGGSSSMVPPSEGAQSNPETPSNQRNGGNMVSSGIMRADQTLMLVQLYHRNHRTMVSCSHDVEGRKTKQQLWTEIAQELNAKYDTAFTVEQFKKKLQNIQCTARMKIQAEKRNRNHGFPGNSKYSQAELEFIRLFEQHNAPQNLLTSDIHVGSMLESLGIFADENGYHLSGLSNGDSGDSNTHDDPTTNVSIPESDSEAAQQLLLALGVGLQPNDSGIFDTSLPARSPSEQSDQLDVSKLLSSAASSGSPIGRPPKRPIKDEVFDTVHPPKNRRKNTSNGQLTPQLALSASMMSHEERLWRESIVKSQELILQNQVRVEEMLKDKKNRLEFEERKLAAINTLSDRVARLCDILASFENSLRTKPVPSNGSPV